MTPTPQSHAIGIAVQIGIFIVGLAALLGFWALVLYLVGVL